MTNKKCSGKRCPLDSTAYNEDCTAVDHCKWFTPKIVTNRQWLESLSDEELAKQILERKCTHCICRAAGAEACINTTCDKAIGDWLQAEHKENDNEQARMSVLQML